MRWTGHSHIGTGWAAFVGHAGDNQPHAHHALQLVVAFAAPIPLWTAADGTRRVHTAVIDRDVRHALLPSDALVGLLYIDAEADAARGVRGQPFTCDRWTQAANTGLRPHFDAAVRGDACAAAALLTAFGAAAPTPAHDAPMQALVERLRISAEVPASLAALAEWTSLSPSRLAHRFRAHTGMPVRPYLRWLRLQQAARAIVNDRSITDAAHEAGFSDAAHLTRTFQRHFGIAPSVLANLAKQPRR